MSTDNADTAQREQEDTNGHSGAEELTLGSKRLVLRVLCIWEPLMRASSPLDLRAMLRVMSWIGTARSAGSRLLISLLICGGRSKSGDSLPAWARSAGDCSSLLSLIVFPTNAGPQFDTAIINDLARGGLVRWWWSCIHRRAHPLHGVIEGQNARNLYG